MKLISAFVLGVFFAGAITAINPRSANAAVANWQKGVTIYPRSNTDFASQTFKQSVNNAAASNANYITLVVPYYQSNLYSTDLGGGWNTPTDEALVAGINYAHSKGLKIMIKPHVDSYTGEWRANINPGDRNSWFANYGHLLVHLAKIGQQTKAEQLCVGSELIRMSNQSSNQDNARQWSNLIAQVRKIYSGKLTYSANWGPPGSDADEKPGIGFWSQLDYAGIAAYYNLNQASDNSAASLKSAWNNWLYDVQNFASSVKKPILFTEIGYKSVTGAHIQPWDYNWGGAADQNEQANSYTALFDFWNDHSFMAGVHLWDWNSDPNYGGEGNTDYSPQNKQAQNVMKQWFGGGNVLTGNETETSVAPNPTTNCPAPASNAFTACFYSDMILGDLALSRTDQAISFDWAWESPNSAIPVDRFSAKWEGNFSFNGGSYTFTATGDDGIKIYVDNNLVINKWFDQPATTYQQTINLSTGNHLVRVEYYENGGHAVAKVSWNQNSVSGNDSPTPSNPPSNSPTIVYINGYPTINNNYIDCRGNIDNDSAHHTTNSNDTDSNHHVGQNCPAGTLVGDFRS